MEAIEAFSFGNTRNMRKMNSALVALLPKKVSASNPSNYRPITMIHIFAKLISKILVPRLAPRLNEMIDKNQNAFIRTRSIHDNFKYVQRVVALIRKKKTPMLLLKLDISKAFDTLSCPFLLEVLQAHGFGEQWRRWIKTLPIRHLRGVRQGDSLSPMLFIIAMDVMHRLFLKASNDGVLGKMHPSKVKFQCSLYADDVILFIHPTTQEATTVKEILTIFSTASGLHTNLAK
jgi:hypothetical protein